MFLTFWGFFFSKESLVLLRFIIVSIVSALVLIANSNKNIVRVIVFNATFNNISAISWRSVLFEEETGVPGENNRPASSHQQTVSHNPVHLYMNCITDVGLLIHYWTSYNVFTWVDLHGDIDRKTRLKVCDALLKKSSFSNIYVNIWSILSLFYFKMICLSDRSDWA